MPNGFVPVAAASALAPGTMTFVAVERERVLLANVQGVFYALRDACGHRQAPLSRGKLAGHVVECPLHFATFDVRTGKLLSGPASADVPTYVVQVEGDTVYVKRAPSR
jgi:3-phenylpropionate/trans-cinnamate dioxygenase ferredoxin component